MLRALSPSPSVAEGCRKGLEHGLSHRYGKEGGVRQLGKKCTKGALRRCDQVVLGSYADARDSNCTCEGEEVGRWMEYGERRTTVMWVMLMVFLSTS